MIRFRIYNIVHTRKILPYSNLDLVKRLGLGRLRFAYYARQPRLCICIIYMINVWKAKSTILSVVGISLRVSSHLISSCLVSSCPILSRPVSSCHVAAVEFACRRLLTKALNNFVSLCLQQVIGMREFMLRHGNLCPPRKNFEIIVHIALHTAVKIALNVYNMYVHTCIYTRILSKKR